MSENKQQQQTKQQAQQQAQQNQSPTWRLERILAEIRKVQNMLEMTYPNQGNAINMLREAGDLAWEEIQEKRQQQTSS